ncbi:MAG: GNAT family N-acetyltransferase, partial [Chthoniobacterales bacterium]
PLEVDARSLARAGDYLEVSATMISIPSPFRLEDAKGWIGDVKERPDVDGYIISSEIDGSLIGAAELRDINAEHRQAEVSFWLTPTTWGLGYASCALTRLVQIGFETHRLNRLYAYHMARNPASGRVMAKCGFHFEGCLRQRVWKLGRTEDAMLWSRLAVDPAPPKERLC